MCGIVGAVAERNILKILLEGLKRLEYRGYDSAGLAFLSPDLSNLNKKNKIQCYRKPGKVAVLESSLSSGLWGNIGIAHTRWATHGKPSEANAHPHVVGNRLAIVHNGIIENYKILREFCESQGCVFSSETDTEVIAYLLLLELKNNNNFKTALRNILKKLEGAYGLVILDAENPENLYAVRSGSPLVIGLGLGENFIASDALSLLPVTHDFIYLEEGDLAEISRDKVLIWDQEDNLITRKIETMTGLAEQSSKGVFKHFMQKEIFEQPECIERTLKMPLPLGLAKILLNIKKIKLIACGTSFHAGCTAAYWFEAWARVPASAEVASEFRYRDPVIELDVLYIFISQSGETADTLAALRQIKNKGAKALGICNVPSSSLVREADAVILTQAGVEIGVASTKAFTAQLGALYKLVLELVLDKDLKNNLNQALSQIPGLMREVLLLDPLITELSAQLVRKNHCLFLGRGVSYPLAMEGALKLKEISYIHAESYPAGELKHGPLALIDNDMPVIAIAPNDGLLEKLKSNLQEVAARGGELIILTEKNLSLDFLLSASFIKLPKVPEYILPLIYALPLQMLAYHVACQKGTDVDQPRNLAKSVTVE